MEPRKFRRPAMLSPADAEEITDKSNIGEDSDIAHASAWALMGVPSEEFNSDVISRFVATVRTNGVDIVAPLWDTSPAFTLPGALWRVYLLWQWHQLNPQVVSERFREGQEALEVLAQDSPPQPPLDEVLRAVEGLLAGYATEEELAAVLESAAQVLRVMAAGITYGPTWIVDPEDQLAHPVTRRPQALLDTAEELEAGALRARQRILD